MELTPTNRKVSRKDQPERRTVFINNKCVRNTCRMSNNNRGKCIFNPASRLKGKQKATKKRANQTQTQTAAGSANCGLQHPRMHTRTNTFKHAQTHKSATLRCTIVCLWAEGGGVALQVCSRKRKLLKDTRCCCRRCQANAARNSAPGEFENCQTFAVYQQRKCLRAAGLQIIADGQLVMEREHYVKNFSYVSWQI